MGFSYSNRKLICNEHINLYQRERKMCVPIKWVKIVVTEHQFSSKPQCSSELPGSQDKMRNPIICTTVLSERRKQGVPQRRRDISEHWILSKFFHIELHIGESLALSIPRFLIYNTKRSKFHEIITCCNDKKKNEGVTLKQNSMSPFYEGAKVM